MKQRGGSPYASRKPPRCHASRTCAGQVIIFLVLCLVLFGFGGWEGPLGSSKSSARGSQRRENNDLEAKTLKNHWFFKVLVHFGRNALGERAFFSNLKETLSKTLKEL